jgi:hypothetical protein
MTEYSGIRGTRVKYLSSDPTLNTSTEGQVWYNSTEGTLKSLVQIKAWSSWWKFRSLIGMDKQELDHKQQV